MKYLIIIAAIFFIFSFTKNERVLKSTHYHQDTVILGYKKGIDFTGKKAYFFGNSITSGVAASSTALRWTTLFCAKRGATEINYGVSGMTLSANACGTGFITDSIPNYNISTDAALFLDFGTNDIGYNGTGVYISTNDFRDKMRNTLLISISKGWPPSNIVVVSPYFALSYNAFIGGCYGNITQAATQARADSFNVIALHESRQLRCRTIDAMGAMRNLNNSWYNIDSLHPNNLGHAFIADIVLNNL